MGLSATLQNALRNDDLDTITTSLNDHPTVSQAELDECLTIAMPHGSLATIRLLLGHGAKLKSLSFINAISRAEPAVFQLLMDSGWDVNSVELERPAVYRALSNEILLRWLLDHGADPNTRAERRFPGSTFEPKTPLAEAARLPDPTPLRILLTYGAQMDPEAIFYAIGVDRGTAPGTATMEVLYDHGADLNFISERWSTPLNFAIRRNLPRKLKFLLDHGADPNLRPTKWDQTAFEYAKERGAGNLYKMLEESCGRETA